MTSSRALYRVRKVVGEKKSGHGGTLDPLATGVLVLCFGRATKLFEPLRLLPKVYRATIRLDVTNDCFDAERPFENVDVKTIPTAKQVEQALGDFVGEIQQLPPKSSAVKVEGVPAYERERNDEEFELQPKLVTIYWMHLHRYEWPEVDLEMCCSGGTYVRSIARDLGAALRTGGCITALRRTRVGPFALSEAWTIEELDKSGNLRQCLIPLEEARSTIEQYADEIPGHS